ncbi:MAG: hypothetical protein ABI423_11430 [Burkholderiales bacterium]
MFEELTMPIFSLEELLRDAGARMAADLKQRLVLRTRAGHDDPQHGPLVMSSKGNLLPAGSVDATAFKQLVLDHLFAG